ncbi:efflux RND transporter permease subunit [Pseudomonas capsici]|uniref:Efflux RND transporter permease subunit n=1 Tax=Pseudomonas capsici TaxID=2810614 RepID=A0ABT3C2I2_9PSED|nr:efflux RND transporter permease subunit [Pseudomonas capsici]MBN6716971.1 efflux RND transporter permease subunit [Pseudomonas capsici]MBN6721970.1 efflux RND transporter permease subunit [Pseudomonas capsici]MBN6726989.1 efflux RND transporter permease subunit [Pseudomonas capsici]MCV4270236.1 efflux RND transporter permease subunit [Pseudomonas capsici]MCV4280535.1 efflux RND transporter permease subunit [Pseudomonas capsici]
MRERFNLSAWGLKHRTLVWYMMFVSLLMGSWSFLNLGREEDPSFAIKTMVIQARWPGATLPDTLQQVTDRLEKKLEEIDALDYVKSYTLAGESTIFVFLKSETRSADIPAAWYQVRKKIMDVRGELPSGIQGPAFNDEFGDVFGSIYAFTADGLSFRQLRDYVEQVRADIRSVPNLGKIELLGAQREVIYLNFSIRKLAALGIDQRQVLQSLQAQNSVTPAGVMEAGPERIAVRTSGQFTNEQDLLAVNLRFGDRFFRLSDLATVERRYADPPSSLFRFNGQPAIGLAVAMKQGGNIQEFGNRLQQRIDELTGELPLGIDVHLVSSQADVVDKAIGGFTRALFEAILIVLVVSFISLGIRAGLVVACSIPLVLALVFVFMEYSGITMQRISLGALIIALGLLVDDAMITVEMMVTRLEGGDSLQQAATFAYTSTAFPMLTGTLVTVAGFVPIGLNSSSAGEYVFTMFAVIAVALLLSWLVAVLFAPLIGIYILKKPEGHQAHNSAWMRAFQRVLLQALKHRWWVIGITALVFIGSLFAGRLLQNQFFPDSDRPEILVDIYMPQNGSIEGTRQTMDRFEATLKDDPDILRWSSYVGKGAVRFYLPLDQQLNNPFYGQLVIVSRGGEGRDRLIERLRQRFRDDFVGVGGYVQLLNMGPPVGWPVQYRVSGPDIEQVRSNAMALAAILDANPNIGQVIYDWNEPGKVLKIHIAQDKVRQFGLSSEDVAQILNSLVTGTSITQVRDDTYLIDLIGRAEDQERSSLQTLSSLQIPTPNGATVPLMAFATLSYEQEQPLVWRRDRLPTITLKANVIGHLQPAALVKQLQPQVKAFTDQLPVRYSVATGGAVEASARSQGPILKVVPLMLLLVASFLMIQLHSVKKLLLVVSVVPLGLIGVVTALLLTGYPLGFVAILGILALIGIIIRNSVILVTQIDEFMAAGEDAWTAVVMATEHRCRPILLTAAAASLGMIPIAREVFWGPMAYAMIGGIAIATVLTLFFLPALYLVCYRIQAPKG